MDNLPTPGFYCITGIQIDHAAWMAFAHVLTMEGPLWMQVPLTYFFAMTQIAARDSYPVWANFNTEGNVYCTYLPQERHIVQDKCKSRQLYSSRYYIMKQTRGS